MLVTDFFGGVSRAEGSDRVESGYKGAQTGTVGDDVRSDVEVESSRKSRDRPLIRQGYLLRNPKRTLTTDTELLGMTRTRGWAEWVALGGLVGLGGIAWVASGR